MQQARPVAVLSWTSRRTCSPGCRQHAFPAGMRRYRSVTKSWGSPFTQEDTPRASPDRVNHRPNIPWPQGFRGQGIETFMGATSITQFFYMNYPPVSNHLMRPEALHAGRQDASIGKSGS